MTKLVNIRNWLKHDSVLSWQLVITIKTLYSMQGVKNSLYQGSFIGFFISAILAMRDDFYNKKMPTAIVIISTNLPYYFD